MHSEEKLSGDPASGSAADTSLSTKELQQAHQLDRRDLWLTHFIVPLPAAVDLDFLTTVISGQVWSGQFVTTLHQIGMDGTSATTCCERPAHLANHEASFRSQPSAEGRAR